jgi:hypothetical protein
MPRGDRTGPMGMGPMTGRAAGYCGGFGMPGYANVPPGGGFGMGLGRGRGSRGRGFGGGGRGWRNWFYATGLPGWMRSGWHSAHYAYPTSSAKPNPKMEKRALESQAEALQEELDFIRKRLEEIGKEADVK